MYVFACNLFSLTLELWSRAYCLHEIVSTSLVGTGWLTEINEKAKRICIDLVLAVFSCVVACYVTRWGLAKELLIYLYFHGV